MGEQRCLLEGCVLANAQGMDFATEVNGSHGLGVTG